MVLNCRAIIRRCGRAGEGGKKKKKKKKKKRKRRIKKIKEKEEKKEKEEEEEDEDDVSNMKKRSEWLVGGLIGNIHHSDTRNILFYILYRAYFKRPCKFFVFISRLCLKNKLVFNF